MVYLINFVNYNCFNKTVSRFLLSKFNFKGNAYQLGD